MNTLDEYNVERRQEYKRARDPHPNGIACPKCQTELWDSDPRCVLASNPPQKNVHCPGCGYRGYRVA